MENRRARIKSTHSDSRYTNSSRSSARTRSAVTPYSRSTSSQASSLQASSLQASYETHIAEIPTDIEVDSDFPFCALPDYYFERALAEMAVTADDPAGITVRRWNT